MASAAQAAIFHGPGRALDVAQLPLPSPRGREVLARIRCTTICGSDLHTFFGRRPCPAPSILGHEMTAEIQAIGPGGATDYRGHPLQPGDRITWSMVWSCGACFFCRSELHPKCDHLMKFGHTAFTPGRELTGGMASHCLLPEGTAIFAVPPMLPDAVASPANCATATVAAVFRSAGPVAGQTVVVHGAGMLGLTACAMASLEGAARVIALEPDPARRALAQRFGASEALDSRLSIAELRAALDSATQGRGPDVALELAGHPDSVETAFHLVRPGGRILLAGSTFPARSLQIEAEQIVRRLIHIRGVYNYSPVDLERALAFLAAAHTVFPFHTLAGPSFPLSEANQAMEYAERERPPRVILLP